MPIECFDATANGVERIAGAVRRDGVCLIRHAFPGEVVEAAGKRLEELVREGRGVRPPIDHRNTDARYRTTLLSSRMELGLETVEKRLSPEVMARGIDHYRHLCNYATLLDPLGDMPMLRDLCFDERMLDVASEALGGEARIGFVKVKWSFANELDGSPVHHFHVDDNASQVLKAIVYLDDVDAGCGPFQYVLGSHRERFPGHDEKEVWSREEMEAAYGAERVVEATGASGETVFTDTLGFHREGKQRSGDRRVVFTNYVLEPEYGGRGARPSIPRDLYGSLGPRAKRAARDFEIT